MEVSGARSSWLTMARSSARSRRVTTTDSTPPSSARIGVALMRVLTRRPSGTESSISSARDDLDVAELLRQEELCE